MHDLKFEFPYLSLPGNKIQRRQFLDEYFSSDLIPFEELKDNKWQVIAFLRDSSDFFVDPNIEKGLHEWMTSISFESMSFYKLFYKNSMLSFNDSWSLYYWTLVLNWLKTNKLPLKKIILFHIDDHTDLDTPLIAKSDYEANYRCLLSREIVTLKEPHSIATAISKKSLGIGSFIAPLLHQMPFVDIFHLKYSHSQPLKEMGIECSFESDQLLEKGALRPSLKLVDSSAKHSYILSSNHFELIQRISNDSIIFLHIDCDGFSNRYNGDSNWDRKSFYIDMDLSEIKEKISELFKDLENISNPIYMNIALSPDFFPSEYWKEVSLHIFSEAEALNIIREDELYQYFKQRFPHEILHDFNVR